MVCCQRWPKKVYSGRRNAMCGFPRWAVNRSLPRPRRQSRVRDAPVFSFAGRGGRSGMRGDRHDLHDPGVVAVMTVVPTGDGRIRRSIVPKWSSSRNRPATAARQEGGRLSLPPVTTGATLATMRTRTLLAVVVLGLMADAAATSVIVGGEWVAGGGPGPYGPWLSPYGYPWPAPGAMDAYGRCLAPWNCSDYEQMRRFLDRYQRNYGARFAPDVPPSPQRWPQRDVPPTPADQIQPAYRNASQVRPEFAPAGVSPAPPAASR